MERLPVVRASGVSKRFVTRRRATSLKERLVNRAARGESRGEFWALRDIDLQIPGGETVGLIGPNGSGKSTLLKVLAGILRPNSGTAVVEGRIASLLELGAGFNAELSGRDNVYLNAALLGLSRAETDAVFDRIVEFSELESHDPGTIDRPVKTYSSGMYVKLGFAVAVHVDPDVLLVDEVLAVGDEAFQEKCLAKIRQFQQAGKTILFVTHGLDLVTSLCTRAVVLDRGRILYAGDPAFAVGTLRRRLGTDVPDDGVLPEDVAPQGVDIDDALIAGEPGGPPKSGFFAGEPICVTVGLTVRVTAPTGYDVQVVVMGAGDIPIWVMRSSGEGSVPPVTGRWVVEFTVPSAPAVSAAFVLAVSVSDPATGHVVAARRFSDLFTVIGPHPAGLLDVPYATRARPEAPVPA